MASRDGSWTAELYQAIPGVSTRWQALICPRNRGTNGAMSAVPFAKPAPAAGDADGQLEGLRRRLDEQAAVTRKTAAQVGQLADSIAALVEAQRRRTRWLNLNSFAAYVVFTVLLGGAFYYVYQSRAHELVAARDRAATERDAAVRRADDATAKLAALQAADAKAAAAAAADKRAQLQVDAALAAATGALKAGKTADVVAAAEQGIAAAPGGPHAGELHYLAGLAELRAGELARAATQLDAAIAGNVAEDDARFQLASAWDRAGQWGKAKAEYDRFATAHPQSGLAVLAMRRSAVLARLPAVAPPVPLAPPRPAAPAPAPAAPEPAPGAGTDADPPAP